MLSGMEPMNCAGLAVPMEVMQHIVRVESSHNPFAVGVVGGQLVRQPKNLPEALATVRMLERRGFNFSVGVAQVNRYNLGKFGLDSYEKAFQLCPNLQAGSRILADCYARSGGHWGKSFSCYYSGNFVTGYRHGYVQKIVASMRQAAPESTKGTRADAIPLVSSPARRAAVIPRHPAASSLDRRSIPNPTQEPFFLDSAGVMKSRTATPETSARPLPPEDPVVPAGAPEADGNVLSVSKMRNPPGVQDRFEDAESDRKLDSAFVF